MPGPTDVYAALHTVRKRPIRSSSAGTEPSRIDSLAVLHVGLAFLPYAALNMGTSSNLPAWVLTGLLLVLRRWRFVGYRPLFVGLAVLPAVSAFVLLLVFIPVPSFRGFVAWALYLVGLPAGMVIARSTPLSQLRWALTAALLGSSLYAVAQYQLFSRGIVLRYLVNPDLHGFSNLAAADNVMIATYQHRAFGWFPEPSFLAGTMILGAFALAFVEHVEGAHSRWTIMALTAASAAVVVSKSGVGILGLPALGWLIFIRFRRHEVRALLFGGAAAIVAWQVISILTARAQSETHSWADRLTSVTAPLGNQTRTIAGTLFGIGRGETTTYFANNSHIGATSGEPILGVSGVFARLVIEQGFLPAGAALTALVLITFRAVRRLRLGTVGAACVATWVFFASLVLAYESTALLWLLPGLVIGLACRRTEGRSRDHRHLTSARSIVPGGEVSRSDTTPLAAPRETT